MTDLFGNQEPAQTARTVVRKNLSTKNHDTKSDIVPAMFENTPIRRTIYNGVVYYSIVDVVAAIIGSRAPRQAWYKAKTAIEADGIELSTVSLRLKLTAPDGKLRLTDCAPQAGVILIIEYLHSPKAAPFKVWFSQLASERIEEIKNPAKGVENSIRRWKQMGKSDPWIDARLRGISIRNTETDTLKSHGISKPQDFAHFTDLTNKAVYGRKAKSEKGFRELGVQDSLRDNSTQSELLLLALHEDACSRGIEKAEAWGRSQIDGVYDKVGSVISNAREALLAIAA